MIDELDNRLFCGSPAVIWTPPITLGDDDTDVDYMRPVCTKCGVTGHLVRFKNHNRQSPDFLRAKEEVTAAWNTRTDTRTEVERWTALRKQLENDRDNAVSSVAWIARQYLNYMDELEALGDHRSNDDA